MVVCTNFFVLFLFLFFVHPLFPLRACFTNSTEVSVHFASWTNSSVNEVISAMSVCHYEHEEKLSVFFFFFFFFFFFSLVFFLPPPPPVPPPPHPPFLNSFFLFLFSFMRFATPPPPPPPLFLFIESQCDLSVSFLFVCLFVLAVFHAVKLFSILLFSFVYFDECKIFTQTA